MPEAAYRFFFINESPDYATSFLAADVRQLQGEALQYPGPEDLARVEDRILGAAGPTVVTVPIHAASDSSLPLIRALKALKDVVQHPLFIIALTDADRSGSAAVHAGADGVVARSDDPAEDLIQILICVEGRELTNKGARLDDLLSRVARGHYGGISDLLDRWRNAESDVEKAEILRTVRARLWDAIGWPRHEKHERAMLSALDVMTVRLRDAEGERRAALLEIIGSGVNILRDDRARGLAAMHWIGKRAGRFGLYSWLDGSADQLGAADQERLSEARRTERTSEKERPAPPEAGSQSAEA